MSCGFLMWLKGCIRSFDLDLDISGGVMLLSSSKEFSLLGRFGLFLDTGDLDDSFFRRNSKVPPSFWGEYSVPLIG